jgi:DivIVA domain-containing protein
MSDLDLPLLPSAEQIRRRQFATVRRGYDPDQVHDYLNQVALQVEALEGELREQRLTSNRSPAAPTPTPAATPDATTTTSAPAVAGDAEAAYERISHRFASVLRAADAEAQKLIEQARTEASKLMEQARTEADRIRVDARSNAEEARTQSTAELHRAKAEADRVLGGLEHRRESLLGQMHEMQSRLLAVAQNLQIPEEEGTTQDPGAHIAQPNAEPSRTETASSDGDDDRSVDAVTVTEGDGAPSTEPAHVKVGKAAGDDDAVDPRYEDMWAAPRPVDMPDLSSLDIDFDEEPEQP